MYQERQSFIDTLNGFISSSKGYLNGVLEELDWSKESIYSSLHKKRQLNGNEFTTTSISDNTTDEKVKIPSENEGHVSTIVEPFLITVGSEALYSELVTTLSQTQSSSKQDENKSKAEVLIEMLKVERDAKRRRINYKNRVHTKHKSHMEILREVLAEQMSSHFGGTETGSSALKENNPTNEKSEMIEVQLPFGNPYTAWKQILEHKFLDAEIKEERDIDLNYHNRDRHSYPSGAKRKDCSSHSKEYRSERESKYPDDRSYKAYKPKYSDHLDTSRNDYMDDRTYRWHISERSHSRSEVYDDKFQKKQRSLRLNSDEETLPKRDGKVKKGVDGSYTIKHLESGSNDQWKEKKHKEKHKRDRSLSSSPKSHKTKKHKRDRSLSSSPKTHKTKKHKRDRSLSSSPKTHKTKKHKRDRSLSSSPKRHKSKKHKKDRSRSLSPKSNRSKVL